MRRRQLAHGSQPLTAGIAKQPPPWAVSSASLTPRPEVTDLPLVPQRIVSLVAAAAPR